ncbi:hypothetical protein CLF_110482 [Clonorchis sinensis]|uniref:Uncharacterized protein n=1 Tax=Clonorchis sinensis TaxID=79923 RepID=G7YKS3_CLOSI|nr:hypothetical protein CLF_110482 [Clonorchis sinensis]
MLDIDQLNVGIYNAGLLVTSLVGEDFMTECNCGLWRGQTFRCRIETSSHITPLYYDTLTDGRNDVFRASDNKIHRPINHDSGDTKNDLNVDWQLNGFYATTVTGKPAVLVDCPITPNPTHRYAMNFFGFTDGRVQIFNEFNAGTSKLLFAISPIQ